MKPRIKPKRPYFSSGPTVKRPGWSAQNLEKASMGRSHRSSICKKKLQEVLFLCRKLLHIPENYKIAITGGSDTGAIEMGMWSLLGPKPVDVLVWDVFGRLWQIDITKQLKLNNVRIFESKGSYLPDLKETSSDHDIVFCWNGTTSGLVCPNGDWISEKRTGLTFCDATSAVFAMNLPWEKLDVTTFSWQKCLGGEAQHGIIILSPRAIERLESYTPQWPIPRLYKLTQQGKINKRIFEGETINTPSLLVVEDALDALYWIESIGGLEGAIRRSQESLSLIAQWIQENDWIIFMAKNPEERSSTSICLQLTDPILQKESRENQFAFIQKVTQLLEEEEVAYDIKGHALGEPCFRIWGGPTVDPEDVASLLPWLKWAYEVSQKQ